MVQLQSFEDIIGKLRQDLYFCWELIEFSVVQCAEKKKQNRAQTEMVARMEQGLDSSWARKQKSRLWSWAKRLIWAIDTGGCGRLTALRFSFSGPNATSKLKSTECPPSSRVTGLKITPTLPWGAILHFLHFCEVSQLAAERAAQSPDTCGWQTGVSATDGARTCDCCSVK